MEITDLERTHKLPIRLYNVEDLIECFEHAMKQSDDLLMAMAYVNEVLLDPITYEGYRALVD